MKKGRLILIPTPISESEYSLSIGALNSLYIKGCEHFVVEQARTARRFISSLKLGIDISTLDIKELNEHSSLENLMPYLEPVFNGKDVGVMSEAGLPAVADPGEELVLLAHSKGVEVVPLVGESSLFIALMSSGLNGEKFVFNGYIPIDKKERVMKIKELELDSLTKNRSNIFIETPYRNDSLLKDLLETLRKETMLHISAGINGEKPLIKTLSVGNWRKESLTIGKIPAIFIIG